VWDRAYETQAWPTGSRQIIPLLVHRATLVTFNHGLHRVVSRIGKRSSVAFVHNEEVGKRHYHAALPLLRSPCEDLGDLLGNGSLDRLVGRTRQVDPHLAEFRHLGNVGVV
jgi:hypothetical protein